MKNFKHLYKDGEDDDDEDCRLKQVLVWYMVTVQHRDQTKRHSTAESAIRLKHDTSFKTISDQFDVNSHPERPGDLDL